MPELLHLAFFWLLASFAIQLFQIYRSVIFTIAWTSLGRRSVVIRWHMRIIRIWQILINDCIISILAFACYLRYETDWCEGIQAANLLMCNLPKLVMEKHFHHYICIQHCSYFFYWCDVILSDTR